MKIILAVPLLLLISDVGFTWGNIFRGSSPERNKKSLYWYPPPRYQLYYGRHMPCLLLEQLFSYKVNQLKNDVGKMCTAAWICRDPATGDTVVTNANGHQITINEHWQMNMGPDRNKTQNNENSKCPNLNAGYDTGRDTGDPDNSGNINNGTEETSMEPTQVPSTQPQTTETPSTFDGEGLIDVRIGSDYN